VSIPLGSSLPVRTTAIRFVKLLILSVMALALLPIMPAEAQNYGVLPGFPTVVNVGQSPVSANLWVINHAPTPVTITDLVFVPSCSNFDSTCAGGIADPGVFTFSPTGTGHSGTACSGQTFNLTVVNPENGQIKVRRADDQNFSLSQGDIASDLDECKIMFTMKANRAPNHDSLAAESHPQTNQNVVVTGTASGTAWTGTNNDMISVVGSAPVRRPVPTNDFNGDGKSDLALFGDHGNWISPGLATVYYGLSGDLPVPADYNGDRAVDRAVYRNGAWYVQNQPVVYFGLKGDIPVPADYDGDGDVDRGVFRDGAWHVQGKPVVYFGLPGDIPVPGDYNGDGDAERAVYRNGAWHVEGMQTVYFGLAGDIPVPADYNGDGDTERAVYRNGAWHVEGTPTTYLGMAGDVPVPGDYDGDGTNDPAVYRNGVWYREGMAPVSLGTAIDIALGLPQAIYNGFF
jgi:hypothetical protein